METKFDELIECIVQIEIGRSHGHTRRDLHVPLPCEQRLHIRDHFIVGATTALGRTQPIMSIADTIEAYRDRESVPLEKVGVAFAQQCSVCRDRKRDSDLAHCCIMDCKFSGPPYQIPVDQRLTSEECEAHT